MEIPAIVSAAVDWVSESEVQLQLTFDPSQIQIVEGNVVPLTITLPPR